MGDTSAVVSEAPPELCAAGNEASVKAQWGRSAVAAAGPRRPSRAQAEWKVRAEGVRDVTAVMVTAGAERPCQAAGT